MPLEDIREELRKKYEELKETSLMRDRLIADIEAMKRAGMTASPVYRYVVDHGQPVPKIPLTLEETRIVESARDQVEPKIGECFRNALMMWSFNHRLKYCEGYTSASKERVIIPIYHAWNSLNGKLVDVTPSERWHYYGVTFPDEVTERLLKRTVREREHNPILDDYVHNYEFLRERDYA